MRLTDLNPRWFALENGGPRVGLTFDCPCCVQREIAYNLRGHCNTERLGIAFHHRGHEAIDDQYIRAHGHGSDRHIWDLNSDEDFDTLTLTPSIDASASGHWHGFVTNGQVT